MTRWLAVCLLAGPLAAQHIRVKVAEPSPDFARIASFQLRPGTFSGRHYKVDEAVLRENLEAKIVERATSKGLRPAANAKPDVVITYSLRAEEEKERPGRGSTRTRSREVMRYELEIRMLNAAGERVWTATGTGEADDWRHKYLEERVLRAVVFAFAKYPPGRE